MRWNLSLIALTASKPPRAPAVESANINYVTRVYMRKFAVNFLAAIWRRPSRPVHACVRASVASAIGIPQKSRSGLETGQWFHVDRGCQYPTVGPANYVCAWERERGARWVRTNPHARGKRARRVRVARTTGRPSPPPPPPRIPVESPIPTARTWYSRGRKRGLPALLSSLRPLFLHRTSAWPRRTAATYVTHLTLALGQPRTHRSLRVVRNVLRLDC